MPSVEYTFELYKNLLLAMVLLFQLPTLAFFLAKMRLVTARFLWRGSTTPSSPSSSSRRS